MEMIKTTNLTKRYGERVAVENLNMVVNKGDIFGFVGPNGAGKTSTIRMLTTLLEPDDGEIWIAGNSVKDDPLAVRQIIGYMPDFFGVYNDMRVSEYLDFFAACYAVPENKRTGIIRDLLELVELTHRLDDPLESLSRGMKQRLSLARTLIHDPKILILDEPASGLDPRARIEIRELLLELSAMGKTIFFSTHILADVAEVCTQVGIIEAGHLVASGPLNLLAKRLVPLRSIQLRILNRAPQAEQILAQSPDVRAVNSSEREEDGLGSSLIQFSFGGDEQALSELLAALIGAGLSITRFAEDQEDLEEVFLRATKGFVT
jgi:ABC-2 type transport system ATP-binding protein